VIPVYAGRPFHLAEHLRRLNHSLAGIQLKAPWDDAWWTAQIDALVGRNGGGNQALYLQITRGAEFGRDHRFPTDATPTVFMFCTATPPREPAVDRDGLTAVTAEDFRWGRCDLKTISLLANVLLKQYAYDAGADEVVLHRDGRLTEASVSNVYLVRDGRIATPPLGRELLPGVTRIVILGLCSALDIPVDETPLTVDRLLAADEAVLSSSTRELAPVVRVDGHVIGDGKPGPVYARLRAEFDRLIGDIPAHSS
jgi:D-alanine transaminase